MSNISLESLLADKRVICVASTPFQLLCLLSIFSSFALECVKKTLIIPKRFSSAVEVAKKIEETSLFDEVICMQHDYPVYKHLGFSYVSDSLFRRRASFRRFQRIVGIKNDKYDVLFCSCADRLSLDVKKYLVPDGCTVFYDEGTGTHSGLCFQVLPCFDRGTLCCVGDKDISFKRFLSTFVKSVFLSILPKESHFNIQHICVIGLRDDELPRFPPVDLTAVDVKLDSVELTHVFELSEDKLSLYKKKKILYLSIPSDVSDDALRCEKEILNLLKKEFGASFGVRLHPRRSAADFEDQSVILPDCNWELLAGSGGITDKHALISTCSSAQVNCKTLFGIEPALFFLPELIPAVDRPAVDRVIGDVRMLYTDKSKVLLPESCEALVEQLKEFVG